jgi:hypothetical protein
MILDLETCALDAIKRVRVGADWNQQIMIIPPMDTAQAHIRNGISSMLMLRGFEREREGQGGVRVC